MLLSSIYTLFVVSMFSSSTTGNDDSIVMTEGRYFAKSLEFTTVNGWIAFSNDPHIYTMLNVARSLYLYYNRHPASVPYSFLASPVFMNRINTLSKILEYKPKSTRPDGINSILHDIQQLHQQQMVQEHIAVAFYEKQKAYQEALIKKSYSNAQNMIGQDQVVPSSPSSSGSRPDTPDTVPLDTSSDGFNDSAENDTQQTNSSSDTTSTTLPTNTVSTTEDPHSDYENQDPDQGDPDQAAVSFLRQQQGIRQPLDSLTTTYRTPFNDAEINAMRPSNERKKRYVSQRTSRVNPVQYYRREKVIVSSNMKNVPLKWFSTITPPFDSNEPVLIESGDSIVSKLIEFLLEKTQEQMIKGYSIASALETALQIDEVRMYVGYWLDHLTQKLTHITEGKAMIYLSHDCLTAAMTRAYNRLRDDVSKNIYDLTNKTNVEKAQVPYIITRLGYQYNIIYFIPQLREDLVAYELKGDDRQLKYQNELFDMSIHPNNTVALIKSAAPQSELEMMEKLSLPNYKGALPTMGTLQKKCTKIRKFYCTINRLRPILDVCLKALILKEPDAFEKCAGKLEKSSQRIVRIALNKFQFFAKNKDTQKIIACTKDAKGFDIPSTGLATVQLNETCKKIFVNNKNFKFEPQKLTCIENANPCTKRITNTITLDKLTPLLDKLIQNPFQESIDILSTLATKTFWTTHKTQIIVTVIIVLFVAAVALAMVSLLRVVRCGTRCCFSASGANGADEHELEPLSRTPVSSQRDPEQSTAASQPLTLTLSDVQGQIIQPRSLETVQPAARDPVNTGSKVGNPPPYYPPATAESV